MNSLSLRTKILTRLAVMSLCSMSVLLIFMYQYIAHVFERDLSNRGRFIARTIGEQSASPILTQKFLTLGLMLMEAKKADKDLAYLFITDPKGNVTAHTFGQAFPVDLKKIGISDKKAKSLHLIRMNNQEVLDISHPIFSGTLGTLHVGMSEARIDTKLQMIFLLASAVIIVLFSTAAWLLWLSLEKIIIRPIKKLEQAIGKVQEVGFEGTVAVVDNDEIGQLGSAFNRMAEHLKAVDLQRSSIIAELNEANNELNLTLLEREQAEARLAESEDKLRLILNSAGEGIFGIDAKGCCTFCNQSSLHLLGYDSPEDLIGKNVHAHVHHTSPERTPYPDDKCRIYQTLLNGKSVHADDDLFWKADHSSFPVEYWSFPQLKDGMIIGTVVTFIDISKRKQGEAERNKLQDMLLQSQKMDAMGTLAGGIAHDFNNILAVICGYTEIARKRCDENVKLAQYLDQIMIASNRARELVRQILTFSRKGTICQQPLELNPLIYEILKLMRSSIPTTISIKQQLNCRANVLADPTQLHQVVMNLCTNAYQAMAEKGGTLAVSLDKAEFSDQQQTLGAGIPTGKYAIIEVSDTGCGMDEETKQKIFEPYFTTRGNGKGSGLGLAVVHGIVQAHGGKITVYSEPGVGSTFRVCLPLINDEVSAEIAESAANTKPGNGERIIFVDDEQQIRDLAKDFLMAQGYELETFSDAKHALELLHNDPTGCDLLVTDMAMPGMSGMELAQAVLAFRPDLPIILCTGYSELINGDSAKEVGFGDYLQKPVLMSVLSERIRILLDDTKMSPDSHQA